MPEAAIGHFAENRRGTEIEMAILKEQHLLPDVVFAAEENGFNAKENRAGANEKSDNCTDLVRNRVSDYGRRSIQISGQANQPETKQTECQIHYKFQVVQS